MRLNLYAGSVPDYILSCLQGISSNKLLPECLSTETAEVVNIGISYQFCLFKLIVGCY